MNICPQCQNEINESANRLIQDACGHKKCRICLLQEEAGCEVCNSEKTTNISVIKFDVSNNSEPKIIKEDDPDSSELIEKEVTHSRFAHIKIIGSSPVVYKCTICSKSFSTNASVKYHSYCGGTERPLKCEKCNKRFISRSHLESHKLIHSGVRPFSCAKCCKTFTQKSKLNRHGKLHTGDRPFACSECSKTFTNKDALVGHFRLHSGEQPYNCSQCLARFNNKSNLTKHLATHTKEKPFMCEQCGKKFGNKWALVAHRKCHNPDRPYNCQNCTKSFAKIKDLKRHNLTHLDIKPFSCKLCHIRFCRKDNLERHLKNTHSIKDAMEIKSATTNLNKKAVKSSAKNHVEISPTEKSVTVESVVSSKSFQEKPNAINVIKMSNKCTPTNPIDIRNAVPVINGPLKLAFKTDAFKNNYNILNREYIAEPPPRIQTNKPYDMEESFNICQKILSPMDNMTPPLNINKQDVIENNFPKNVIMSVGKVNEKDSLEICKKILTPTVETPLHYETSFEHKQHAVIKNIKFKLPSTYTNNALNLKATTSSNNDHGSIRNEKQECSVNSSNQDNKKQSVIVNNYSADQTQKDVQFSDLHWRRRTAQNLQPKMSNRNS